MIYNTFIFNPIRPDYLSKCLNTLYKYTNMSNNKVIVVDQTNKGLFEEWEDWKEVEDLIHLYLRPHRNLGFSKSMNEGIIHGMRWDSKYITVSNDDIEFIDSRWWDGIIETFNQDEKIMAVNPMSPKEPGWGYGLEHGAFLEIVPYKEKFSKEDYDFLLQGDFQEAKERFESQFQEAGRPNNFPAQKRGVIDAIATWCTVFKKEAFDKFGLFEERYYPGGGEDYDLNARVYREGYRMVGTTRAWVWHHWGSSKDTDEHKGKSLPIIDELRWCNPDAIWPPEKNLSWVNGEYKPVHFDPWGKVTLQDGSKKPMFRVKDVGIVEI